MSKRNLTLLTDLYELTMMQGYYEKGQNEKVIFDVDALCTNDLVCTEVWSP